jgi:hypothetical protein
METTNFTKLMSELVKDQLLNNAHKAVKINLKLINLILILDSISS